ncbi:MAG: hypothetical protein V1839_01025 [archaeon]
MAIADSSAAISQPKYWSGEEFKQNICILLEDICKGIRATEPADMHDRKLVYRVLHGIGNEDLPEMEDAYKGTLKRKMPFYVPNKLLAEFSTYSAGENLTFRILDEATRAPIESALEKHKDKFGKINIRYGSEKMGIGFTETW